MDPESKKLLEETYTLTKENNKMLRTIRRKQKWASFMRLMYWLIIIGISIGAFYYLQPYIYKLESIINSTMDSINDLKNVNDSVKDSQNQLKGVNLDQFKGLLNR